MHQHQSHICCVRGNFKNNGNVRFPVSSSSEESHLVIETRLELLIILCILVCGNEYK